MFNGPENLDHHFARRSAVRGKRLPNIARNLGKAQSELKKGLAEGAAEAKKKTKLQKPTANNSLIQSRRFSLSSRAHHSIVRVSRLAHISSDLNQILSRP
ncbi:hypothetical protein EMGBS4_14200 [Acidimicrobiaceae bacterium]|nr:hypothetical protein EMGBS4_14200 [Acidimicrobiaceae bacterium]